MNIVDWLVVASVVLFALLGWRTGFIQGLLGFAGFLTGAILAARLLPNLAGTLCIQMVRCPPSC